MANADDAFGSSVGLESTGIYSESDTRGFSPVKAGNARIDGIYYDPVGSLSARLRHGNLVRVGFTSEDYPFHAPTGIIDYRFKPFPDKAGFSPGYNFMAFGGFLREFDVRLPMAGGRMAFLGGGAQSDLRQSDGSSNEAWGLTGRLIARLGDVEIAPFVSTSWFTQNHAHPLVVVRDSYLPRLPKKRQYLGQQWASGHYDSHQFGGTLRARFTDRISLRAGLFYAKGDRAENYSEIFTLLDPAGRASHRLIADPLHRIHSLSGEAQLVYRVTSGDWQHRFIAGFRGRNRYVETGGSDIEDFGEVTYGALDPETQPVFQFGPVNAGRVRQSSFMLGYTGKLAGVGTINLGLQKARYRGSSRDGQTGAVTASRDNPWLYNATVGFDLTDAISIYLGTERGLEDSGTAPESATNRNVQLPATRTTQYEGGVRWKFDGGQFVVSGFQITKPYFSFDQNSAFAELGTVRHRGVEVSFSGQFGSRLHMLAGAVVMQPRVEGIGRTQGLVGERPTGTPSVFARIDANYRTDIFGGLTPTASLTYTGKRAAGSRPQAALGGRQLMVPGHATLDLGLRQQFKLGNIPASFRFLVYNVFDAASWKVTAANTLYPEERRRMNLSLAVDF